MRTLGETDRIRLNIFLRYYCVKKVMNFSDLAQIIADHARVEGNRRDVLVEHLKNFLMRGTLRYVDGFLVAIDLTIREMLTSGSLIEGYDLEAIYRRFAASDSYMDDEMVAQFFNGHTEPPFLVKDLATKLKSANPADSLLQSLKVNYRQNIGQVFSMMALMFDKDTKDASLQDKRFQNKHFVCIRRSSEHPEKYVVHGLKFWNHDLKQDLVYFSEKYELHNGAAHSEGRESRGVCFFDGDYLKAIARPGSSLSLTYFVGRLPQEDTFQSFRSLIMTSNSQGVRIAANAISLLCETEDDKHQRTGVFSEDRLLELTPDRQKSLLQGWIEQQRDTRPFRLDPGPA